MSYSRPAVELKDVWKKYSRESIFHRSIREDIASLFRRKSRSAEISSNEFWALRDIAFTVERGQTIGLYGPNGAGKSTILKLIASVTYPTKGRTSVWGRVAPLIEIGAGFHPDLTGRENIFMNGTILGMNIPEIREKMNSIIAFSEMEEFIDMPVKKYSSGMYLRLGFSIAIHSEADIYLIDEILTVGDETFQKKCLDKIFEMKNKEKTLIVITHDRNLIGQIADDIIFMKKGEIVEEVKQ
ncbi:MAG TPA: ABC transporter ATP-binding protein [Dissulfurispiraceae bacterium]